MEATEESSVSMLVTTGIFKKSSPVSDDVRTFKNSGRAGKDYDKTAQLKLRNFI